MKVEQSPSLQVPDVNQSDDNSVSSSGGDSVSTGTLASDKQPLKEPEDTVAFGRKENDAVRRLRLLMIGVLLAVTAGASAGVYLYSRSTERTEFENEFSGQGFKVISGFQADALRKLQAMDSLSRALTSYALNTNSRWPYVTMPSSSNILEPYLDLGNAAALFVMPIVPARQRAEWEEYSVAQQGWIEDDLAIRREKGGFERSLLSSDDSGRGEEYLQRVRELNEMDETKQMSPFIKNDVGIDTSPGSWYVWWQYAPVLEDRYFVNYNRLSIDGFTKDAAAVVQKKAVLSSAWTFEPGLDFQSLRDFHFMDSLLQAGGNGKYEQGEPIGYIYYPVFDTFDQNKQEAVGILGATVYWRSYFLDILPSTVRGVVCVVENSAGQFFTYSINGRQAEFMGMDDLHDKKFSNYGIHAKYSTFAEQEGVDYQGVDLDTNHITYTIHVYPSKEFEAEYITDKPILYTMAMLFAFLFTVAVFAFYDCYVERRQKIVLSTAVKSTAVVSSLFPEQVRDRLMDEAAANQEQNKNHRLKNFLQSDGPVPETTSKPIADFFPETTIMFADIRGFTAWSSVREPTQVFVLLETLYGAFDEIARKRRVFKVETVGDCYVAVCGLPDPRKDHAVVMARFARDCMMKMLELTKSLEVELGPDTGDLNMRFGLHSGPVTGGVLRGEKSRFQLFGDAMNTASRMESTGEIGRIQLSSETAKLIQAAGKGNWLQKRTDKVFAKGKGEMETYWLQWSGAQSVADNTSVVESLTDADHDLMDIPSRVNMANALMSDKIARLVNWNCELLCKLLKQVVAWRQAGGVVTPIVRSKRGADTVLEEVEEVIPFPTFDPKVMKNLRNPEEIDLGPAVEQQLQDLVKNIAVLYRDTAFHNFEHASHVTMSVSKLLSRMVGVGAEFSTAASGANGATVHESTYGITSDPLTHFACVFSALIHDADHTGVPNAQLAKENEQLAGSYKHRSIAEQNSVDLSWGLLMHDTYKDLQKTIFVNEAEKLRFRQLVATSVMATDIMDKDLNALRRSRWTTAFAEQASSQLSQDEIKNSKATIVVEHLIQASDVAHTMQHWHIFRKWNERLFEEMNRAYEAGRSSIDPATNWYQGELGFFDFYIIPLAKKLKDCGVFGVSSDEYLNYAENNRREWEARGQQVVAEMVERIQRRKKLENLTSPSFNQSSKTIRIEGMDLIAPNLAAIEENDMEDDNMEKRLKMRLTGGSPTGSLNPQPVSPDDYLNALDKSEGDFI